jgi:LGFP repeat
MQDGWRWCNRCQGLAYAGFGTGICWDGQPHDFAGSGSYAVNIDSVPAGTQDGWRWCNRCQGMVYAGFGTGISWDGQPHDFAGSEGYSVRYTRSMIGDLFPDQAAAADAIRQAIDAKAAALGPDFTGARQGVVGAGIDSWDIAATRYEKCTIFYRAGVGAFEIHGGIRAKFEAMNLGTILGMPITDETACADGVGRFNRFANGSIYWHPDTGPYALHGAVLNAWLQRGAERGPLGYPASDQSTTASGAPCCIFQNGGLSQEGDAVTDAAEVRLSRDGLLNFVWQFFDRVVHQSPDNIGLHPHKSMDKVSRTYGDFRRARNRIVTITVNGFRDNGLLFADTDWSAQMDLLIREAVHVPPDDIPPERKDEYTGADLVVELMPGSPRVVARGGSEQIAGRVQRGVSDAISDAFTNPVRIAAPPDARRPTFPLGSDFVGVIVRADGSLSILFGNTDAGRAAASLAQHVVDSMA